MLPDQFAGLLTKSETKRPPLVDHWDIITRVAAWLVGVIHPLSKSPWPPKYCRLRTIKMDKKMEDDMEAGPLCDGGTYMITNRILRSI